MAKSYSTFSDMAASNFASISGPTKSTKTSGPDDGLRGGSSKAATSKGIMSFSGGGGDDGGGSKTTTKQVVAQQTVSQDKINQGSRLIGGGNGLGSRQTDTKVVTPETFNFNEMLQRETSVADDYLSSYIEQSEQEQAAIEAARAAVLNDRDFPINANGQPAGLRTDPLDLVNVEGSTRGFSAEQIQTGLEVVQSLKEDPRVDMSVGSLPATGLVMPRPRPENFEENVVNPARIQRLTENWNTENINADDVRFLQDKLSQMQGGLPVNVGTIDGVWGNMGRNALWTFQQRNNIRPTGEMNAETAEALKDSSNLMTGAVDLSALERPSIRMLVGMEEFRVMPYTPMNRSGSSIGRSGLTFAAGIDVGQHTAESLKENFGFTDEMIEEIGVYNPETNPTGWIGRRPPALPDSSDRSAGANAIRAQRRAEQRAIAQEYIRQREAGELPVVDEQWMIDNTNKVYDYYVPQIESRYNSMFGEGEWDRLPEAAQAIPVLERYRGDEVSNIMLRALNSGNFIQAANMIYKPSRRQVALDVLNSLPEEELQFKYFAPEESLVPRPRPNQ